MATGKNLCSRSDGLDNLGKSGKAWGNTVTKNLTVETLAKVNGLTATGTTSVPTKPATDSTTSIASTAFVHNAVKNDITGKAEKSQIFLYVGSDEPTEKRENLLYINPSELEITDTSVQVKKVNGISPDGNGNIAISSVTNATNASKAVTKAEGTSTTDIATTEFTTRAIATANHYLKRNTAYSIGDIAYSPNLPSWAYLECTTAGTTGASEPDFSSVKSGG